MIDAIMREWLRQTLGTGTMIAGVGEEIRQFLATFYADDGLVQLRCPVRLQTSLDTLVSLFERVDLRTNVSKTKTMVCVPGRIRTCQTWERYTQQIEGQKVLAADAASHALALPLPQFRVTLNLFRLRLPGLTAPNAPWDAHHHIFSSRRWC